MKYRAAIAGLGQAGLQFDYDPNRPGVFTHFAAYRHLKNRFDLVAVADPMAKRLEQAKAEKPELALHRDLQGLLADGGIDVISLCTPTEMHAGQILQCAGKVKAIICEKPLGSNNLEECRRAVAACRDAGTLLAVNYHRRFQGFSPHAKRILSEDPGWSQVRVATVSYSGPLDAVGSHAVDTLLYMLGPLELQHVTHVDEDRFSAVFRHQKGGLAVCHCTGPREDFIFELDLLGPQGRLRVLDDAAAFERYRFYASPRYGGYRELHQEPGVFMVIDERFVPIFEDVADVLDGVRPALRSPGEGALGTQEIIEQLRRTEHA